MFGSCPRRPDDRRRARPRTCRDGRRRHATRRRRDAHGLGTSQPRPGPRPSLPYDTDPRTPRAYLEQHRPTSSWPSWASIPRDSRPRSRDSSPTSPSSRRSCTIAAPQLPVGSQSASRFRYIEPVSYDVEKSDHQWRTELSADRYAYCATRRPNYRGPVRSCTSTPTASSPAVGVVNTSSRARRNSTPGAAGPASTRANRERSLNDPTTR